MALLERIRHPRRPPHYGLDEVRVRVRGGYQPNVVYATAGKPIRIVFRREETTACSASVVFPDFGKSATLPPYEDVAVELLPSKPGEYAFTCQAGILTGQLVVLGGANESVVYPRSGIGTDTDGARAGASDR
jgi:plastocyanin domain-containing protein